MAPARGAIIRNEATLIFDVVNLDGPVSGELRAEIEKDGVLLYEEI